ncbi:MAG: hypothetical protein RBT11_15350 [Desulfobacterales bacterium]|nr:hypothetical protein [Desulfobacterales bacterium]
MGHSDYWLFGYSKASNVSSFLKDSGLSDKDLRDFGLQAETKPLEYTSKDAVQAAPGSRLRSFDIRRERRRAGDQMETVALFERISAGFEKAVTGKSIRASVK